MAEVKDKVPTVESIKAVHDYAEDTYFKKTDITLSTEDLIEDESFLESGKIWLVYEE